MIWPLSTAVRYIRSRGCPVFMLHRVLPDPRESYSREMAVSTAAFRCFLNWILSNYSVKSLADLVTDGQVGKDCALTFDDGWQDVYQHAFPVMQELGVHATVFLPTSFIGTTRRFWQERLYFCLRRVAAIPRESASLKLADLTASLLSVDTRATDYPSLRTILLTRSSTEAECFVTACEKVFGVDDKYERPAFMTWQDVSKMQRAGFTFGSHTVQHTLLTRADDLSARDEICKSRLDLEARLGETVTTFAYPWGASSGQLENVVREARYHCAVTTAEALKPSSCNLFAIPRVFISDSILCTDGAFNAMKLECHMARIGIRNIRSA